MDAWLSIMPDWVFSWSASHQLEDSCLNILMYLQRLMQEPASPALLCQIGSRTQMVHLETYTVTSVTYGEA